MDFIDLFQRGGIAMYPILLCSVAAVTVFCKRLWCLRLGRLIPEGFVRTFRDYLALEDWRMPLDFATRALPHLWQESPEPVLPTTLKGRT
ncbi:hypothetical protein [Desulfomonile tiedjei]|uniref:hypothetical protein n=1 Tax=Desulfomonile tiedjei TaxID=2358 RepID=UPI0006939BC1|nr:hypothetical protein [Desulfomonile tiedjei]